MLFLSKVLRYSRGTPFVLFSLPLPQKKQYGKVRTSTHTSFARCSPTSTSSRSRRLRGDGSRAGMRARARSRDTCARDAYGRDAQTYRRRNYNNKNNNIIFMPEKTVIIKRRFRSVLDRCSIDLRSFSVPPSLLLRSTFVRPSFRMRDVSNTERTRKNPGI